MALALNHPTRVLLEAVIAHPPPPASDNPLTPEEQMAAFEKDLKENDWGHQPC